MAGVIEARERFAAAEASEEGRDDATIYRSALDVFVAFAGSPSGTAGAVSDAMAALSDAIGRRAAYTARARWVVGLCRGNRPRSSGTRWRIRCEPRLALWGSRHG